MDGNIRAIFSEKWEKYCNTVQNVTRSGKSDREGIVPVSGKIILNSAGCIASSSSISIPAEETNRTTSEIRLSRSNIHSVRSEILWWSQNLRLNNGRSLILKPAQLIIQSDASKEGWGAYCWGVKTGGPWTVTESQLHINILEMMAAKLAIIIIYQKPQLSKQHSYSDGQHGSSLIFSKNGGTKCQELVNLSKQIFLFVGRNAITN